MAYKDLQTAISSRECVYLVTVVYILFCFCDLDLDPMTLTYEFDLDILKMYPHP